MRALGHIFRIILRAQSTALWRGALLSFLVLAMGAALLGLSGWFISATAAAGLAGVGAVFDVFRPSAMVRFLALGRAAARYGERVLTHDATLRALEELRVQVLGGLIASPYQRMLRIRGAQALNRLTADIDALDGVPLRLVLPIAAGVLAQLLAFVVIWSLVGMQVAAWICAGYLCGAAVIFWQTIRKTRHISRRSEAAAQAFRSRLIDLIRARGDLAVQGQLVTQMDHVLGADARRKSLVLQQDLAERLAGAAVQILGVVIAGGALWLGVVLVQGGSIAAPFAALGFFAALALAETVAPLRRAASDLGRMIEAARRVSRDIADVPVSKGAPVSTQGPLEVEAVTLHRALSEAAVVEGFSISVRPRETVAITGASGAGKSTLLLAISGLHPLYSGVVKLGGVAISSLDEAALRREVVLLPQRSALMAGSVAESLRLAAPDADDATLWAVLEAVQFTQTLKTREGLETVMGPRGDGLSGGEARRLTLARALLRQPHVLLLDEPTEGLDELTAKSVLAGVRSYLPNAAILIASHRRIETDFADRIIALK